MEELVPPDVFQKEFPQLQGVTYADHAGTTVASSTYLQSVYEDLSQHLYGNPHSRNPSSSLTSELIDQVRLRVLSFFNASTEEWTVVFTSGATQGLKLVGELFPWSNDTSFTYAEESHTSVVGIRELARRSGAQISCVPISTLLEDITASSTGSGPHLLAVPTQCNFSGSKYVPRFERKTENAYLLLDTASFAATSRMDLQELSDACGLDFAVVSFYKMLGYPTGLGALLIRKSRSAVLKTRRDYFGGGTVDVMIPDEDFHQPRQSLHERLEDGTLPFLDIIALRHGIDILDRIGMMRISHFTFSLVQTLYMRLKELKHYNGKRLVKIYATDEEMTSADTHGGILAVNLRRADGEYIGYSEVEKICELHEIHLRTGCFCNLGACKKFLGLTSSDMKENFQAGHVCGDAVDLIRGRPTGAVRISFGYMSQRKDVETIVKILKENFIENSPPNDLHVISNGLKENRAPTSSIWLSGLSLYPIKSCAAQSIEGSWPLDDKGLQFDRHWLITTGSGVAVTQKRLPQLAVVHPNVQLSKHRLQLNATATEVLDPITIPLDHDAGELSSASLCSVRVCGDRVPANVLDDVEVSDWLRDVTGTEGLRLTEQTEVIRKCRLKNVAGENSTPISFANESQFVLVSLVSIRQLKDWMKARNPSATLDQEAEHLVSRFRPNIVIDGDIDAFEEDNWKTLQIGNQVFESLGPCNRCQMVCIDQKTGEKSKEPLTTLSTFRGPRIPFGIHLRMINQGTHAGETPRLTIGDEVTITERQVNATNGLQ